MRQKLPKIRACSSVVFIGLSVGLVWAMTGCNLPGQQSTASFSGSASSTSTPPLSGSGGGSAPPGSPGGNASNVLNFEIGDSGICGTEGVNEPCASITICEPGTSTCQTISDLLVDTGSYGLRIFSNDVSLSLPQLTGNSGQPLAECAQFGTGVAWGPVVQASVQMGGEAKATMPIQLINGSYAGGPPTIAQNEGCATADLDQNTNPNATTGFYSAFNGILGVGLLTQDCGSFCTTQTNNSLYYYCTGDSCLADTVSLANQVVNPVAMLSQDSNGLLFSLSAISSSGVPSISGTVTFGVGTESNNKPGPSVKTYAADSSLNFTTDFNDQDYTDSSFIDSGSNAIYLPSSVPDSLIECDESGGGYWFCPNSTVSLTATNVSASGGTSGTVSFSVADINLLSAANDAFDDIAGGGLGFDGVDWGLPFFFGKTIYVGVSGTSSTLGSGPYWAY